MLKESNSINYGNVHRLERGDRVHFKAEESHRSDWNGPREFDVTVSRTILHSRFGPRIVTYEKIGDDEENDFYLDDDWTISLIAGEQ